MTTQTPFLIFDSDKRFILTRLISFIAGPDKAVAADFKVEIIGRKLLVFSPGGKSLSFDLSFEDDADAVSATLENFLLTISIPVRAEIIANRRQVVIQTIDGSA
jgi:hypothetical protein